MKREDVKAKIPGITDEQLNWLMDENGSDINAEKGNAARIQGELDTANATIKNLRDTVKKYDGVDVEALRQQLGTLQTKYDTDIAAVRRDSAIDLALSARRAKNSRAARALLDLDGIKLEGDKLTGLDEQLEEIQKENPWLFGEETGAGMQVDTGREHGNGGSAGEDGVFSAFLLQKAAPIFLFTIQGNPILTEEHVSIYTIII
ncbi:MAG: phage scaffolding protein [Clostridia bacterium]|nr:phage scaffolding protein [Clostridia bacterium]MDY5558006.1 phage scaffolding protein [Candidatus Heritagella sp.]